MKKKKLTHNNNLATAAIAAVVSLVIVLVFAGGSITGNATTANYALTATVTGTVNCDLSAATLAFGSVAQSAAAASDPNLTIQNDGSSSVDIVIRSSGTIDNFMGASSGSTLEATMTSVGSGATGTNVNITTSDQEIVDGLVPTDANDDATVNFVLTAGSDATAGAKSGTNVIITCSEDT